MKTGIVNSRSFLEGDHRIDPDLYLSNGAKIRREIHNLPYELSTVGENAENVFYGNIFSRMFVSKPSHGVEYLAASDTVLSDLHTGRYISKIQAKALKYLILEKGWILVTCSGTLGNVTYTTKEFAGKLATHDLIRIIPNSKKVNAGTLYAFLSSKYGYFQITQSQFGGVVKHINESQMSSVLVPVFPESFQTEVDNLIQESARLREEANDKLEEAIHLFEDSISSKEIFLGAQSATISSKQISSRFNRFDSQYQIGKKLLTAAMKGQKKVKLNDIKKSIFIGNRGKRCYVNKGGIPFLSSSNMMLANPTRNCKYISRNTPDLETFIVEKDYILISRSGTVGNTVMVGDTLKGYGVTEDAIRLVVDKSKIEPEYVFAYLKTRQGKKAIKILPFGSVIVHLNEDVLADVDLPIIDDSNRKTIVELVKVSNTYFDRAIKNENKAIKMVEDEIEKWNKAN